VETRIKKLMRGLAVVLIFGTGIAAIIFSLVSSELFLYCVQHSAEQIGGARRVAYDSQSVFDSDLWLFCFHDSSPYARAASLLPLAYSKASYDKRGIV